MVLATGPGLRNKKGDSIAVSVQTGDKVLLPQFGGTTLKVGDDVSLPCFLFRCVKAEADAVLLCRNTTCSGSVQTAFAQPCAQESSI